MLSLTYTALFGILAIFLWKQGHFLDRWAENFLSRLSKMQNDPLQNQILWLQGLISGLRAGQNLEEILIEQARNTNSPRDTQEQIQVLLSQGANKSFIGKILSYSIANGTPCLDVLQSLRRQHTKQLRSKRRMRALMSQAQVQAWIIAILPWLLLFGLFCMDGELSQLILRAALSWLLWFAALALDVVAIRWLTRIAKHAFNPRSNEIKLIELELLPFLRQLQAYIAAGRDIEDSVADSLDACAPSLAKFFLYLNMQNQEQESTPREILVTRQLLMQSIKHGSPIRQELNNLAEDIESQQESRWEEALQLLPIKSLAPLFCCAFPAALLILFSFLGPLLAGL